MYWQCIRYILTKYLGFGRYLADVDPLHRPWAWQVQQSVVYCYIHFKRGVERAVQKAYTTVDKSAHTPYSHMLQLLQCKTEEEYLSLCDGLMSKYLLKHFETVLNILLISHSRPGNVQKGDCGLGGKQKAGYHPLWHTPTIIRSPTRNMGRDWSAYECVWADAL